VFLASTYLPMYCAQRGGRQSTCLSDTPFTLCKHNGEIFPVLSLSSPCWLVSRSGLLHIQYECTIALICL
jgi:hypothetical protein